MSNRLSIFFFKYTIVILPYWNTNRLSKKNRLIKLNNVQVESR